MEYELQFIFVMERQNQPKNIRKRKKAVILCSCEEQSDGLFEFSRADIIMVSDTPR